MRLILAVAVVAALVVACGSEEVPVTADDYRNSLLAVCAATASDLDALPKPPDQISVTDFATEAANILDAEAAQARRLEAPDELAGDHRAFIRNTREQADAWRAVANGGNLDELTNTIGQLSLGRDDLVAEMDLPACRRSAP